MTYDHGLAIGFGAVFGAGLMLGFYLAAKMGTKATNAVNTATIDLKIALSELRVLKGKVDELLRKPVVSVPSPTPFPPIEHPIAAPLINTPPHPNVVPMAISPTILKP